MIYIYIIYIYTFFFFFFSFILVPRFSFSNRVASLRTAPLVNVYFYKGKNVNKTQKKEHMEARANTDFAVAFCIIVLARYIPRYIYIAYTCVCIYVCIESVKNNNSKRKRTENRHLMCRNLLLIPCIDSLYMYCMDYTFNLT